MPFPRVILFDMDGTLTEERLQWDDLRESLGVPEGRPILESLLAMSAPDRAKAEEILHRHEYEAASRSVLNPGCVELLHWLDAHGIGRALITRNTRRSVQTVFDRCGLHFDVSITREDGEFKPDPAPLRHACQKLGVATDDAWMIGDWKYDIEAANNANVHGVWLSFGRERTFDAVPDRVVHDLVELFDVLKSLKGTGLGTAV
ncbi:MAG TPA: HAD family hydrolase [Tepidisphaeraceae bacterium]|jgi:HAD superfamily hydrolase (TIGR01509 family)